MNIFYLFYVFFTNGVKTFRMAAKGSYIGESESVRQIREEMMNNSATDSDNLRSDWKNIGRDVRTSFNKLTAPNG